MKYDITSDIKQNFCKNVILFGFNLMYDFSNSKDYFLKVGSLGLYLLKHTFYIIHIDTFSVQQIFIFGCSMMEM